VLHPTTQAAVTLKEYGKTYGDLDLGGLSNELWKPWEKSTWLKTKVSKARMLQNAYKSGVRRLLRELVCDLRKQKKVIQETETRFMEMR